ncbi:MAG: electron transport complex protein RnfC [Deltaproteobacteria bacterium]|nr:electron transport complex protein RnfC [Deltaproteobacteria bacterium]
MRDHIVEKVKSAGVVGAGGAGFPTHVKVNADVETVLVNGASCEPLLMSDPYLLEDETELVVRGLEAVVECTGAKSGIICLKGKHSKAMEAVAQAIAKDTTGKIKMFELKDFYPAGDEQVLVREVLGKTVPEAGIPLQVGVVVSNVESLLNIALALEDKPVTDRYVTVTGEVRKPMIVKVPVGTSADVVIGYAGGSLISDYRVVDGGPMMGRILEKLNAPVTKTTSGLIVLPPEHNVVARKIMEPAKVRRITNMICCQCSQCTDLCPRNLLGHALHPHKLMRALDFTQSGVESKKEALLCSECGICEKFACPMMISPREVNAQIKKELAADGIRWDSTGEKPINHPFREDRYIPTKRLMQRLDVIKYDTHPVFEGEVSSDRVVISLNQHIGAPSFAVVSVGDTVNKGDLIGEIPENALGARIHASIDGQVESIENGSVTIGNL